MKEISRLDIAVDRPIRSNLQSDHYTTSLEERSLNEFDAARSYDEKYNVYIYPGLLQMKFANWKTITVARVKKNFFLLMTKIIVNQEYFSSSSYIYV